jgi:hypothetical protein
MDEQKIREYIELARLVGYKLAVGEGWLSGALDGRCCCPMGAVVAVQRHGRAKWLGEAISDYVRTAARALRCSDEEVQAFVSGYDAQASTQGSCAGVRYPAVWDLGLRFRREANAMRAAA